VIGMGFEIAQSTLSYWKRDTVHEKKLIVSVTSETIAL
jgi:hypothetical protein